MSNNTHEHPEKRAASSGAIPSPTDSLCDSEASQSIDPLFLRFLDDVLGDPQSFAGKELGHYRLVRELGRGGMGVVFLADDPKLNRQVAIKVMRSGIALNPEACSRFLREARAVAAVRHDNVVPIYHVDEHEGMPYLVMALLDGESLEARLDRDGALSPDEAVRIAIEAALGLCAAHEKGIVHRDVKPSNLWLESPFGRVKVFDFGLARSADGVDAITLTGAVLGTLGYMAPEQADGRVVDSRVDIFSLGATLYRCVTGRPAFNMSSPMAMLCALTECRPEPPSQVNPQVSTELSEMILLMLEKDPANRPQTARDVINGLTNLIPLKVHRIAQPTAAKPRVSDPKVKRLLPQSDPGWPSASPRSQHRFPLLRTVALSLLAVFIAGMYYYARNAITSPDLQIISARYFIPDIDVTFRNISNEPIVIHRITITVIGKNATFEFVGGSIPISEKYCIPVGHLDVGGSNTLSVSHVIGPHGVDRILIMSKAPTVVRVRIRFDYNIDQFVETELNLKNGHGQEDTEMVRAVLLSGQDFEVVGNISTIRGPARSSRSAAGISTAIGLAPRVSDSTRPRVAISGSMRTVPRHTRFAGPESPIAAEASIPARGQTPGTVGCVNPVRDVVANQVGFVRKQSCRQLDRRTNRAVALRQSHRPLAWWQRLSASVSREL